MTPQNKTVIPGKVQKNNNKKFKIKKNDNSAEIDIDIEISDEPSDDENTVFEVDKLSLDGLPTHMNDGNPITWFNNFAIKKNKQYINQKYKVTIPGISNMGNSKLVIFDGNGDPYYYTGTITDNTFELTDGDPAAGMAP